MPASIKAKGSRATGTTKSAKRKVPVRGKSAAAATKSAASKGKGYAMSSTGRAKSSTGRARAARKGR